jgi:hypothetical protein
MSKPVRLSSETLVLVVIILQGDTQRVPATGSLSIRLQNTGLPDSRHFFNEVDAGIVPILSVRVISK